MPIGKRVAAERARLAARRAEREAEHARTAPARARAEAAAAERAAVRTSLRRREALEARWTLPQVTAVEREAAEADLRVLARRYGPAAFLAIVQIATESRTPVPVRLAAWREVLDRSYGRPAQAVAMEGMGSLPPVRRVIIELQEGPGSIVEVTPVTPV